VECAPDIAPLEQMSESVSGIDAFWLWARLTRLNIFRLNTSDALKAADKFVQALNSILASGPSNEVLVSLAAPARVVNERLQQLTLDSNFTRDGESGGTSSLSSREANDIIVGVSSGYFALQAALLAAASASTADIIEASDKHYALLDRLNYRKELIEFCERLVQQYPQPEVAPRYLLKLADFYEKKAASLGKAAETYQRLCEDYPSHPDAEHCRFQIGMCLYNCEDYPGAMENLQLLLAANPNGKDAPAAQFICALSEAGMGMNDEAESHLRDLISRHPTGELAVKAMLWIGSNNLSKQKYPEAIAAFDEVVRQYPDSPYAEKARQYIKKLKQIPKYPER
jgi:TolA-binding protein